MKNISLIVGLICLFNIQISAQNKVFSTTKGEISFFSNAPLEDISAKNIRIISMLNTESRELVVRVPVNQFEFPNKLMQKHFNENYLESEKYPYATFKGKISEGVDFDKPGTYEVNAVGILNIHGVDQKRTLTGKITVGTETVRLDTKFIVALEDHKIDIPKLVFNKIAEKIAVTAIFNYQPFKK